MTPLQWDGPKRAKRTVVLAHGAGAGMDSDFMVAFAEGLAERRIRVCRFEFPYMQRRRETGVKAPPDRLPRLLACWREVIEQVRRASRSGDLMVLAGKSMGGRIASLVAADAEPAGLVCLGYPFHPVGKPAQLRIDHLAALRIPTLILQGERDAFGTRAEVTGYDLNAQTTVKWLPDGDHSFKPRQASGRSESENRRLAIDWMREFVLGVS